METTNDYDVVRNMTLLFFLERLLERGQPRSLHDLSCQVKVFFFFLILWNDTGDRM